MDAAARTVVTPTVVIPTAKPSAAPRAARPDAVKIPYALVADVSNPDARKAKVVALAEAALGVGADEPRLVWAREQRGFYFCTPNKDGDTLFFPHGHEMAGRPRYSWTKRADGVELGALVDG